MPKRTAVIIGAGPAGLTAAYEFMTRTDIEPMVLEMSDVVGGIARTIDYKGNLIDIGGHRFYSKDDSVMAWWQRLLPVQSADTVRDSRDGSVKITYQNKTRWLNLSGDGPDPETEDDVMLVRARLSRILFIGKLFDYPISLSLDTLMKLGPIRTIKIGCSYLRASLFPIRPEETLEEFFINRFGRELYTTFFRDYTEKVWGIPCGGIPASWGAQRIKGISIASVIKHAMQSMMPGPRRGARKETETSLIEQFLYPKYGVGQMWQKAASVLEEGGYPVRCHRKVVGLAHEKGRIISAMVENLETGETEEIRADYFFSTMPVRELISGLAPAAPPEIRKVSDGLIYRDFLTVGLLLKRVKLGGGATAKDLTTVLPDNWMYIQERHVKVGRIQFYNNWSPYMVTDPDTVWVGLEYFVDEGDELWRTDDDDLARFAIDESETIGLIDKSDVLDHVVIRVPKAYPAYFGSYGRFDEIKRYTDTFENLFLVGRNGMHQYNNQDHSMLSAMSAVTNIISGNSSKENIWNVNPDGAYQESK